MFQGLGDAHGYLLKSQITDSILIIGLVAAACIDTVGLSILASTSQTRETRIQTAGVVSRWELLTEESYALRIF